MPSDRTTVTELGTGLGMLGLAGIDEALRSRTAVMHSLSPEMWERLDRLRAGGAYDAEFHAAWANGQAFLPPTTACGAACPRWSSGRAPAAPRATRWRPSTCASTTSTWSAASTSRRSSSTSPRPASSTRSSSAGRAGAAGRRGRCSRRRRLVRRGGAGRVPGPLRGRPRSPRGGGAAEAAAARSAAGPERGDPGRRPPPRRSRASAPSRSRSARVRPDHERRGAAGAAARPAAPRRRPHGPAARRPGPVAPRRLAGGRQGPLRRAVERGRPGLGPPLGGGDGGRGGGRRGHALAPPAHRERALLRAGLLGGPLAAPAHRHLVGLAPAVPAGRPRHGGPAGRPAPGGVGGHGARPGLPRGARRGRAHRGALEPRPFRRAPRGQGLPRHGRTTSFRGISRSDERLRPRRPSLPRCESPNSPPRRSCSGPTRSRTSPWCARPRPIRSSPPSRRCRGRTRTTPAGPSSSASTRASTEGDGYSFVIAPATDPESGVGSIGLWLQEIDERARLHRLLARRRRARAGPGRLRPAGRGVVRVRRPRHPAAASLRRALERGIGPDGRGRRLPPRGDAAGLGAHRRRATRRRLLRPPACGVGSAGLSGTRSRPSARLPRCSGAITRTRRSRSGSTTSWRPSSWRTTTSAWRAWPRMSRRLRLRQPGGGLRGAPRSQRRVRPLSQRRPVDDACGGPARSTSITGTSATAGSGSSGAPSPWRAGASAGWTRRGPSAGS